MEIKLIKNSDKSEYSSIDNNLLLQVVDDNYQFMDYKGKKLYILNVLTNERFEIAADIKKYYIADISYIGNLDHCVLFTSVEQLTENRAAITVYRYMFYEAVCQQVYRMEVPMELFDGNKILNIFALDNNYLFIEQIGHDNTFSNIILHDIVADKQIDINNTEIGKTGIRKMLPLGGNMGVILYGTDDTDWTIGIVNVRQMTSELVLDGSNITMECLDKISAGNNEMCLKVLNDRIIYSRNDNSNQDEIVIYDYVKKVKKVRLNNYIEDENVFDCIYVIDDIPYYIRKQDDETEVINLDTQKVELKFPKGLSFKYIKDDILIVQKDKKRLLSKDLVDYIEVYKYPHMHHCIFRTKAEYNGCVINDDELFIITN